MRRFAIFMVAISLVNVALALMPTLLWGDPVRNWFQPLIFGVLTLMYVGKLFRSRPKPIAFDADAIVDFRRPMAEHILELVGAVGMAAVGLFLLLFPNESSMGLTFGILIAVVGVLVAVMIVVRGRPELRATPAGLWIKGIKSGVIPWDAIASITPKRPIQWFDMGHVIIELRRSNAWKPTPQRRIPIIHPAKIDPDGSRITLYSDFFGTELSTLGKALSVRQQIHAFS